jgi:Tol biopolymer transport system component
LVDDLRVDERFSRSVFAASANGVLVCMTGAAQTRTQLRWIDRTGKALGDVGDPADYTYGGTPEISPDGLSAAMPIANRDRGMSEIWVIDLDTGRRRKLALDTNDHPGVAWLPDGKSVAVASPDDGRIVRFWIDGTRSETILSIPGYAWPYSAWGDYLLFGPDMGNTITVDLAVVPWKGGGTASPLVATKAFEDQGKFSPDGRWVAHISDESGRTEVFVSSSQPGGGRWQISQNGGMEPRWNRNGRELLYVDRENYIVSVAVHPSAAGFEAGASQRLFQFHGAGGFWRYDITPDGERFLVAAPLQDNLTSPVTLITDWTRKVEGH